MLGLANRWVAGENPVMRSNLSLALFSPDREGAYPLGAVNFDRHMGVAQRVGFPSAVQVG